MSFVHICTLFIQALDSWLVGLHMPNQGSNTLYLRLTNKVLRCMIKDKYSYYTKRMLLCFMRVCSLYQNHIVSQAWSVKTISHLTISRISTTFWNRINCLPGGRIQRFWTNKDNFGHHVIYLGASYDIIIIIRNTYIYISIYINRLYSIEKY